MYASIVDNAAFVTICVGALTVLGFAAAGIRSIVRYEEGPRSERKLLHGLDEAMTGRPATRLEPHPPPGIVDTVASLAKDSAEMKTSHVLMSCQIEDLRIGQEDIVKRMVPNGLTSDNPGDVLQHVLRQNEEILRALDIDPAVCTPIGHD